MSMTSSIASTTTTLPTPAHSVNGSTIPSEVTHGTSMGGDSPHNKRKRESDDMGDRVQKKVHVEDRNLGLVDLHLDVGEKYLLCRTRKALHSTVQRSDRYSSPLCIGDRSCHSAFAMGACGPPRSSHIVGPLFDGEPD